MPTHAITYKWLDGTEQKWLVQLLDRCTGATVTEDGEACWSLSPEGRWNYTGPLNIQRFPHGSTEVVALGKPPKKIKKGQEPKFMPNGAVITVTKIGERWEGVCSLGAQSVIAESAGLMGLGSKLCRKWLAQFGYRGIAGKP